MKKPVPRPLGQPPHPLAGNYRDRLGRLFIVPARADFELYRMGEDGLLATPDSPLQKDAAHFEAALAFGTFTRINH